MNIFELEAVLRLNSQEYEEGIKSAKNEAQHLSDTLVTTGSKITQAGYMTENVSRPARNFLKESIGLAQEWEYGVAKVEAISGVTGEEMDAIKNKAAEVAKATKWTMSEAAEALQYMGMAGWKGSQMLGGLEPIMYLAAATGADLGSTSDIVTDAMTALGLVAGNTSTVLRDGMAVELEDTARFADVLAAAATNSNTNVEMLGESFKYAAPVAGSLGYSIEDLAIALGLMANTGVKASMGGPALRSLFTNLSKPTEKMQIAMDTLGISLTDDEGKMYSLQEVMGQLRRSFGEGHLSAEEFQRRMELLDEALEDGTLTKGDYTKGMEDLQEAFDSGSISVDEFQRGQQELDDKLALGLVGTGTYEEAVEQLTTAMYGAEAGQKAELAAMLAGKYGMSGLLAIVNATEEDYNKLTDAIYGSEGATKSMYETMMGTTEGASARFESALDVFKTSLGETVLPYVTQFLEAITTLINKFNDLDEGTQKFIAIALGVVGVLGPILIIGGKLISGIGMFVGLLGSIGGGATAAAGAIGGIGAAAAGAAGAGGIGALITAAAPILIGGAVVAGIIAAVVLIVKHWDEIKAAAKAVGEWVADKWNKLKDATHEAWEGMKEKVSTAWNNLKQNVTDTTEAMKERVSTAWNNLKENVSNTAESVRSTVSQKWDEIKTNSQQAWDNVKEKVSTAWNNIKEAAVSKANEIATNTRTRWEEIRTNTQQAWDNIKNKTHETWESAKNSVRTAAENMWNSTRTNMQNIKGDMESKFTSLMNSASSWGHNIVSNLSNALHSGISWIQSAASNISNALEGGISGMISRAFSWGSDIMANLSQGIWRGISWVADAASSAASKIWEFLHFSVPEKGPLADFDSYAPDMMKLFAEGIKDNEDIVTDQIAKSFDFTGNMTLPSSAGGRSFVGGNITINVYGGDKDAREIANEVVDIIVSDSNRRLYAFG